MRARNSALLVLTCTLTLFSPAARAAECQKRALDQEQLQRVFKEAGLREKWDMTINEVLETTASTKRLGAPSGSAVSTSLVDGPSLSELIGLAVETGLVSEEDEAYTLSLNFFSFLSIARPEVLDLQSKYEKHEFLRRWGGSATFGGVGDAIDQDGDGTVDDPLQSEHFDDIVAWEVQYRFYGTRDRRDRSSARKFYGATGREFDVFTRRSTEFLAQHMNDLTFDDAGNPCEESVEELLASEDVRMALREIAAAETALNESVDEVAERIDNSMVWTLVLGGTEREDVFGPDRLTAAIRGAYGKFTINGEWSRAEGQAGAEDPEMLKAGVEHSWLWLQDASRGRDGIEVRLAGAYEKFDNVPGATNDTNAKLNARLDVPLIEGIKIPVSITWANHASLLEDEDEIRGHVGFTFDTKSLAKIFRSDD